jgi:hypothetical protein
MGVAGLGLAGAGAHAVFTTNTSASQTVNAGTLSVVESSPNAPGCTTVANNCTSITLSPVGPEASTFDTTADVVTLTNTGNIPAYYSTVTGSETNNNATFASEVSVCDYSLGGNGAGHFVGVDQNSLVSGFTNGSVAGSGPEYVIQPGATDSFSLDFYAGQASSVCGGSATPSLTQPAEGGSLSFTIAYGFTG